ncbi:transcriptional regulator, PadR-like family [Hirschia baltica ATCC 49814]|uniref:Transcriptional regulator, PadR-like family n=1 Tax=Hirschia baltica (strain ATCC 49814 / DSM 5838 / IFAM 1418) TaxID=582402 RepID=C6XLJ9_HIRBI|nr:transcriptional regulator, PadR-like family [Hirschia baltica ATCC 49814]
MKGNIILRFSHINQDHKEHGHKHHRHRSVRRHKNGHRHASMRRNGGRRRVFDAAELRLVLLHFISTNPKHGYDLIRAIEEHSGGSYAPSPGVVYPALSMLEDIGFISAQQEEGGKKAFSITPDGESELQTQSETTSSLLQRLESLASEHGRLNPAPVKRAMENIKTALRNRMTQSDATDATALDIAAIIDEATHKIERL